MKVRLRRTGPLRGEVVIPPDKSISHRAVMFSSMATGRSVVMNPLFSGDTISTMNVFRAMGAVIEERGGSLVIEGAGRLKAPAHEMDCGNSGTTMRLVCGVLSGQPFNSMLAGDESLSNRPMKRVMIPLREMGARITASRNDNFPPLSIQGTSLRGIRYEMPVASAQVKSAILLAGLFADGETEVLEKLKSRDHTERMLPAYGAIVESHGLSTRVTGGTPLCSVDMEVPGDFSSAAFFIVAASIVKGSELLLKNVGINPTRTGLISVMRDMGALISVENERIVSGEPVGDIVVRYSRLRGIEVPPEAVPSLIDEFPVLCVAASVAEGPTNIRGAEELRVKESDRISAMATRLRAMGVAIDELDDGMCITGRDELSGAELDSAGDHRIAMSMAVASLVADGETVINNAGAVGISFPDFFDMLLGVSGG